VLAISKICFFDVRQNKQAKPTTLLMESLKEAPVVQDPPEQQAGVAAAPATRPRRSRPRRSATEATRKVAQQQQEEKEALAAKRKAADVSSPSRPERKRRKASQKVQMHVAMESLDPEQLAGVEEQEESLRRKRLKSKNLRKGTKSPKSKPKKTVPFPKLAIKAESEPIAMKWHDYLQPHMPNMLEEILEKRFYQDQVIEFVLDYVTRNELTNKAFIEEIGINYSDWRAFMSQGFRAHPNVAMKVAKNILEEADFEVFLRVQPQREKFVSYVAKSDDVKRATFQDMASNLKKKWERLRELSTEANDEDAETSGNGPNVSKSSSHGTRGLKSILTAPPEAQKDEPSPTSAPRFKIRRARRKFDQDTAKAEWEFYFETLRICTIFKERRSYKKSLNSYHRAYFTIRAELSAILQALESRARSEVNILLAPSLLLVVTITFLDNIEQIDRYHSELTTDIFSEICSTWRRMFITLTRDRKMATFVPMPEQYLKDLSSDAEMTWETLGNVLIGLDICVGTFATKEPKFQWKTGNWDQLRVSMRNWLEYFL